MAGLSRTLAEGRPGLGHQRWEMRNFIRNQGWSSIKRWKGGKNRVGGIVTKLRMVGLLLRLGWAGQRQRGPGLEEKRALKS